MLTKGIMLVEHILKLITDIDYRYYWEGRQWPSGNLK